jgi:hypothetical protein
MTLESAMPQRLDEIEEQHRARIGVVAQAPTCPKGQFTDWPSAKTALSWLAIAGNAMKRSILLVALLLGGILLPSVGPAAADQVKPWRYNARSHELPFPRSERAQSVWASGACWSECGSYCAWGFAGCLTRDAQGQCLKLTDKCDRYCQRECRTLGGPLLPIEFFWE